MKIVLKVVVALVLAVVVLLVLRNSIIQKVTRNMVLKTTGFDLEIGRLNAAVARPVFEVSDARLINPEDFPEATALEIKTLRVGYNVRSLLSDEIHLTEVTVDVPRAVLVIREDGESNLSRLGKTFEERKAAEEPSERGEEGEPSGEKTEKPQKRVRVDVVTLKIGRVEMRRYREGESKPEVKTYDLHFERTATDVTDLQTINGMITAGVIEAVGRQALQGLSKALEKNPDELEKVGDALQKAADGLKERLGRLAERAEKGGGESGE